MNDQIIPVSFHGDTLALIDHDGEPFVAMKPVVENMGLTWHGQHAKLTEKFGPVILVTRTTGGDGKQYEMTCLPLRKLPAWLYSIVPSRVKPELREKIVRYQDECDDVLWKYWTQGYVERPGGKRPSISQQLSAHGVRMRLLKELKVETDPAVRAALHQQLAHASRLLGIDTPALGDIGHAEEPQPYPPLLETFWEAVELIGLEKLNHARNPLLVAINLVHFHQTAAAEKIPLPAQEAFRRVLRRSESPRFLDVKTTNSALLGRSVKCWVFEAEAPDPALH